MKQKNPIKSYIFSCDLCHYITTNKKDYDKHLMRLKHQNETKMKHLKHENPNRSTNNKNLYVPVDYPVIVGGLCGDIRKNAELQTQILEIILEK
jgi:hypothetical protein